MSSDLDEDALEEIYSWIDKIPLSRAKKNIARDFSDGGSYICTICTNLKTLEAAMEQRYF